MNYRRLFVPNAYVFLTVVTYNRKPILIENIDLLRAALKETKKYFNFEIIAVVVLPEHFHIIFNLETIEEYPQIIKSIKYNFSEKFNFVGLASPTYEKKREKEIWQRRYWEHTIINEEDFNRHLDYIHYNPVKHGYVKCTKDWEYSSFKKFVEQNNYEIDWGSEKDIEKIKGLNYD